MSEHYLQEIFSSIQGEGPYVGSRQIFIRFAGCNWTCAYCDTPTNPTPENFLLERTPGKRDFLKFSNPLQVEELAKLILQYYDLAGHHSISLTGGEPLLYQKTLKQLIPRINGTRNGIFLETNGTLPEHLESVIKFIDIVSMDIKLESSTKIPTPWDLHWDFLKIAAQKKVYVKIVISSETTETEIEQVCELISKINPEIELIFQPVTPKSDVLSPSNEELLQLQKQALSKLKTVRVIPQTHLMMGQL